MYFIRPNALLRNFYPSAIWRIPAGEKKLFLTFDDGPVPEITSQVLSDLKKYNAKATFFCVGSNIDRHPDIFRQVISEGHSIGNHTYSHLNGWKTQAEDYLEDIEKCSRAVKHRATNPEQQTYLFRPPYGKIKKSQISLLKSRFSLIMWDVLSGDFDPKIPAEKCLEHVLTKTREGSIVVFHDSLKARKNLFHVLPKFLEHFSNEGFEFALLPSR